MSEFTYSTVNVYRGQWNIATANLDLTNNFYLKAVDQAYRKHFKTMDADQAGAFRTSDEKYQSQLMGTLAEIYVEQYIIETLKEKGLDSKWFVERYDDVRTDNFSLAAGAYDMRIISKQNSNEFYRVEGRSSNTGKLSLQKAISDYHLIGPYESIAKPAEPIADFNVRPLYEFTSYKNERYNREKFQEYLISNKLKLHIVAGCTGKKLSADGAYNSFAQRGTRFLSIPILNIEDAQNFKNTLFNNLP